MTQKTIYIRLLNEGTDVWRPVSATKIDNNIYRIEMTDQHEFEEENWEFEPNTLVYCEKKVLMDKECLIALNTIAD